jgi:ATP adenylyltransferase
MMTFPKGTLWTTIVAASERALKTGALLSVATNQAYIDDSGIRFFVRILAGLRQKDEARKAQQANLEAGKKVNPFLPPEPELTIGAVTETHIAVLNKYNVVENHLLIITKEFEEQELLLTLTDFEALWLCMSEYSCLAFYNGGREAGASQQHKHIQLVPLPLAPKGPAVPIQPLFPESGPFNSPMSLSGIPFLHSFSHLKISPGTPVADTARLTYNIYLRMLLHSNIESRDAGARKRQSLPYCFLMTREWMLLVPRSAEFFEEISFNSLAFAGSLFVRDAGQLERLRSFGPMNALKAVSMLK